MEKTNTQLHFSVGEFIALANQTLDYAFGSVEVEGEVASFKVNQGKYVFFDIKDAEGSIGCFMTVWQLREPIEDGMKVIVSATPKLTQWGKFSLTVRSVRPSGEGAIKKSFEILRDKLKREGLFDEARKRVLPAQPHHIAVVSSTGAAGYADFVKILDERWGGLRVDVAHVQVQGSGAADQMIRALRYFNGVVELPEVIVVIRGGGSADDLSSFNDEKLVREIAASRVPTIVGVGHETDVSLADMAADKRAATPSNAAQIVVPDKHEIIRFTHGAMSRLPSKVIQMIGDRQAQLLRQRFETVETIEAHIEKAVQGNQMQQKLLHELDPNVVLRRGYAVVHGKIEPGNSLEIEKSDILITAEVTHVTKK